MSEKRTLFPVFLSFIIIFFAISSSIVSGDDLDLDKLREIEKNFDWEKHEKMKESIRKNWLAGEAFYNAYEDEKAIEEFRKNLQYLEEVFRILNDRYVGEVTNFRGSDEYYDFLNSLLFLGYGYYNLHDYQSAITPLEIVKGELKFWAPVFEELDRCYQMLGKTEESIRIWEEYAYNYEREYGPRYVPALAYKNIGWYSFQRGDYEKTVACGYKTLSIVDREKTAPLLNAGLVSLLEGDLGRAYFFYTEAIACPADEMEFALEQGINGINQYCIHEDRFVGKKEIDLACLFLWAIAKRTHNHVDEERYAEKLRGNDELFELLMGFKENQELEPYGLYIMARFFSLNGKTDEAIEALRRASLGSPLLARQVIEDDEDFEYIRENTDYREIFPLPPEKKIDYQKLAETAPFEVVIQDGHHKSIEGMRFSPDGHHIITCSTDQTVRFWSLDGKLLKVFKAEQGALTSMEVSRDGERIITGTLSGSPLVWSSDGEVLYRLEGEQSLISPAAISPDGAFYAFGDNVLREESFPVNVWSRDGKLLRTFWPLMGPLDDLSFSPDSRYLIAIGWKEIQVWDVLRGSLLRSIKSKGEEDLFYGLSISPDGRYTAAVHNDDLVFFDSRLREEKVFSDLGKKVGHLVFSDASDMFLIFRSNKLVELRGIDGKMISSFEIFPSDVRATVFSPDGLTFLTLSGGDTVRLWSTEGDLIRTFEVRKDWIYDLDVSPRGDSVAITHGDKTLKLFRMDGSLRASFPCPVEDEWGKFDTVSFSPDGGMLLTGETDYEKTSDAHKSVMYFSSLWDLTGKILMRVKYRPGVVAHANALGAGSSTEQRSTFLPNGKAFLVYDLFTSFLFDLHGKRLDSYQLGSAKSLDFHPGGDRFVLTGYETPARIFRIDGKKLRSFDQLGAVKYVAYSPDGELIALCDENEIRLVRERGEVVRTISGHSDVSVVFCPDGGSFAAASNREKRLKIWNLEGEEVKSLPTYSDGIRKILYTNDGKYIVAFSDDISIKIWNLETERMFSLISYKDDWLIFTPDGYFDCSRNGGHLIAMVKGLEGYGIDQFALARNRPDIILSRMDLGDKRQIRHYYAQYVKRLAKFGYLPERIPSDLFNTMTGEREILSELYAADGDALVLAGVPTYGKVLRLLRIPAFMALCENELNQGFHTPEARLLKAEQEGKFVDLTFHLSDSLYALIRYNVYVNDVPLFGAYGKQVDGEHEVTITERIELAGGENKVEITCFNSRLAESYRELAYFDYAGDVEGDLYFLGFGVSDYLDSNLDLNYSHKDVQDLVSVFKGMRGRVFRDVHVKVFLNEDVTVDNIRKSKEFLKDAKIDDTLVLFISGHGVHDDDDEATYYYLTYETRLNDLAGSAANFDVIEDILQGIKPRNKLFLMDTCESGEVEEVIQQRYFTQAGMKGVRARTMRGSDARQSGKRGGRRSRRYLFDRERYIYNDLQRRSGAIVLSSSKGGEFSYESDSLENGLFTEAIIGALTHNKADTNGDGVVSTDELRQYVIESVPDMSGDLQHPTVDRDNLYQKFGFPIAR